MHIATVIKEFAEKGTYTSFLEYYKTLVESKIEVEFGIDDNDEFDDLFHIEFYNDLINSNIDEIMDVMITYSKSDDMEDVRNFFEFNAAKFKPENIVQIYRKCGRDWYGWTSSPHLPLAFPDIMCTIINEKDGEIETLKQKIKELECSK